MTQASGMVIRGAVLSDVGKKRKNNEDAFGLFPDLALYVVSDGMGGHASGEVASNLTVEMLRRSLLDTAGEDLTPVSDSSGNFSVGGRRLMIALQSAHESVLDASRNDPSMAGMGATVAAVLFDLACGRVAICHVGDSRVYRIRGNRIEQMTQDHTLVQRLVADGKMRPEDVHTSEHRHVLTQAVGSSETLQPALRLERPVAGDAFLLCSDGIHDLIRAEEMLQVVRDAGQDLQDACARLVALANERGGRDNSTVLVVSCVGRDDVDDDAPTLS